VLSPLVLRRVYSRRFVAALPPQFGRVIRERLERGWATHPNATNPYAWRLLLGRDPPRSRALGPPPSIRLACADAAGYLASCPPGLFDAFTLSNILDGASEEYQARLCAAVRHAAAPNAIVTLRSLAEPEDSEGAQLAARDRSLLWGSIRCCEVRLLN